jgi:hypothetical protein
VPKPDRDSSVGTANSADRSFVNGKRTASGYLEADPISIQPTEVMSPPTTSMRTDEVELLLMPTRSSSTVSGAAGKAAGAERRTKKNHRSNFGRSGCETAAMEDEKVAEQNVKCRRRR